MRPITATVGPLSEAADDAICMAQTGVTSFALNGVGVTGDGEIELEDLTSILLLEDLTSRFLLEGNVTATVVTLDTARRVLITSDGADNNKLFTITGTDCAGMPQTEVLTGPSSGSVYTALDFKTVTSVTASAPVSGNVSVGTNGVASSPWVMFDTYAFSQVALQCDATGTVDYTVQQTLDDPNSPTNPVLPYNAVWVNNPTSALVNAGTSQQGTYAIAPLFAKVTLNSGTGSVRTTFIQYGSVVQ